jgi:stage IV sporulation protein FB
MVEYFMKVEISWTVFVMGAALVLTKEVSMSKMAIIISAALIHELGHIVAALLLKIPIKRIRFDIFGAAIETYDFGCSYIKEILLCICGPMANILASLAAICADCFSGAKFFIVSSLLFAFINVLPIKGFDGERALSCALMLILPPGKAYACLEIVSFVCVYFLWLISVYFIMRTGAYLSLFVFSGALFIKLFCREKA